MLLLWRSCFWLDSLTMRSSNATTGPFVAAVFLAASSAFLLVVLAFLGGQRWGYFDSRMLQAAPTFWQQHSLHQTCHNTSFASRMKQFPLEEYIAAIPQRSAEADPRYHELKRDLLHVLVEYATLEPFIPANTSCNPPPLPAVTAEMCALHPTAFQPGVRATPAKVAHLIQFGMDADTLEVLINELYDVVEYIFITESVRTHLGMELKPLAWEMLKFQPRFAKFLDKIVHLIVDESYAARNNEDTSGDIWKMEHIQEQQRWQRFLQWNEISKVFGPDDIVGFGDTDEVPSRSNVQLLKHCRFLNASVDVGIWFPFGNISTAFRTDHPVPNHEYTLGDPTFWTFEAAVRHGNPTRMRGRSRRYVLGGVHFSHYGYLPYQLIKGLSATESDYRQEVHLLTAINNTLATDASFSLLEDSLARAPLQLRDRIVPLDKARDDMHEIAVLPWFYDCNRDRYPRWEGRADSRIL
jgi:hypothetical protein